MSILHIVLKLVEQQNISESVSRDKRTKFSATIV